MTRRTLFLAALLLALPAAVAASAPAPAYAKGSDGDGKGGKGKGKDGKDGKDEGESKPKDPKDTPEWKACDAVAAEFQAKNAQALVDRMEPKGRVSLKLGAIDDGKDTRIDGSYGTDQAKQLLQSWFDAQGSLTLKMKKIDREVGECELKVVVKDRTNVEATRTFFIRLKKKDGGGFWLVGLEKG